MKPLADVFVLDLAGEPGIFAGRMLADLGATVVCVEPPGGSHVRGLEPFLDGLPEAERSARHLAYNAGKESVVLDLGNASERETFRRLARRADVLIETARPGELEALGLDYRTLSAVNPGIIQASITPFGQSGPWSGRRGSDLIGSASGGLLAVSGEPERPPVLAGGDLSYKLASLAACTGVLAALVGRDGPRNGYGAHLDISIQECVTLSTLQTSNANYWRWYGIAPPRNTAFEFPVIRCKDGGWVAGRPRPDRWDDIREWALSCGLAVNAGPGDWQEANKSKPASFRLGEAADIVERLGQFYTREEFLEQCAQVGVIALPVHSFEDMRRNEHLRSLDAFRKVRHEPLGVELELPRSPFVGVRGVEPVRRAPTLGEHTAEVLAWLDERSDERAVVEPSNTLPMAGLRVLDISWVLAGPIGGRILANLGAEVIKIESEVRMDATRRAVLPPDGMDLSTGGWFNCANSAKLSATVNTSLPQGPELLGRLAARCDVVIDNLRPGVIERMGVSYAELRKENPGIIVAHLPGPGSPGPWAGLPSFGNQVSAAAGLNAVTGFPGTPPTGLGVAFADFVGPYLLASAVLAAVRQRERTGEGQEIEVAQLPGTLSLLGAEWLAFAHSGTEPPRRANRDPNSCPHGVYAALGDDEWVAIAVDSEAAWIAFTATIGRPELAGDQRFRTHALRKEHEDELDAIVSSWTSGHDRWEAATLLQERGVAAAAVEDIADQLDRDPGLGRHYQTIEQPTAPGLIITANAEPIRFEGADQTIRRAPGLGEHNEYVFREIVGLSDDEFAELAGTGVIG